MLGGSSPAGEDAHSSSHGARGTGMYRTRTRTINRTLQPNHAMGTQCQSRPTCSSAQQSISLVRAYKNIYTCTVVRLSGWPTLPNGLLSCTWHMGSDTVNVPVARPSDGHDRLISLSSFDERPASSSSAKHGFHLSLGSFSARAPHPDRGRQPRPLKELVACAVWDTILVRGLHISGQCRRR